MGKLHELKCDPAPFEALWSGAKRFEWRKDDRGFRVGDVLLLRCDSRGRFVSARVLYILHDAYGVPPGYCVMSIDVTERGDL